MVIQTRYLAMRILLLFPITTVLSFISGANTLLSILGLVCLCIFFVQNGVKRKSFFVIVLALLLTFIGLMNTELPVINQNEIIYLVYMCVYLSFVCDNKEVIKEYFEEDYQYIFLICLLWNIIVLISLPLSSSYDGSSFTSFTSTTYRLSPSAVYIISLSACLIETRNNKKYVWLTILPYLSILLGSSRTYLVVGSFVFLLAFALAINNSKKFVIGIVVVGLICVLIIINSAMGNKFLSSVTEHAYQDPMGVFTSGRSNFWVKDLNAFNQESWVAHLIGCGFNFIRITNGAIVGTSETGIWAHNDFIQILITNGCIGLILYIYVIRRLFKTFSGYRVPIVARITIFISWFFNAMFNMYYTYTCSMLSLPLLMLACHMHMARREKWFENVTYEDNAVACAEDTVMSGRDAKV